MFPGAHQLHRPVHTIHCGGYIKDTMSFMPFLDTLFIPQPYGSLNTTAYRKPIYTAQYLQWDSHQTISAKYSVVSTLYHRTRALCSSPKLLQKEDKHLQNILSRCKYPIWALNRMKLKVRAKTIHVDRKKGTNIPTSTKSNNQRPHMVIPYTKGPSESLKNVCSKHRIQVYFGRGKTIRSLLVASKEKDPITKKSRVIYRYKCDRVECDEE